MMGTPKINPIRAEIPPSSAHWCWDGVNRTSVVLQDFWFLFLNWEACCFYLFIVSTLSKGMSSLLHFQGMLTHLT